MDAVESAKSLMLWKYKMKDLGKIRLTLGWKVLYDEATEDYSMNPRNGIVYIFNNKFLPLGGARV